MARQPGPETGAYEWMKVEGLGFGVLGVLGVRFWGLRFRVWGLQSRVLGFLGFWM